MTLTVGTSCKKEPGPKGDTGAQGPQGNPGPDAKKYDVAYSFGPSTSYNSFDLSTTIFDGDDMVNVYFKDPSTGFYIQTPYTWYNGSITSGVQWYAEVASITLFINGVKPNNVSGSPWSTSSSYTFRVVVVKASAKTVKGLSSTTPYNELITKVNMLD